MRDSKGRGLEQFRPWKVRGWKLEESTLREHDVRPSRIASSLPRNAPVMYAFLDDIMPPSGVDGEFLKPGGIKSVETRGFPRAKNRREGLLCYIRDVL